MSAGDNSNRHLIRGPLLTNRYRIRQYEAAKGGDHYGSEIDALIVKKFGKHYALTAKYAFYDAKGLFTDTEKIWLQVDISF